MKIVRILGGLGNQMFQYAFALSLEDRYPDESVCVDRYAFNGYPLHDGYLIDKVFNQKLKFASKRDVIKLNYPFFNYRLWQVGKRILPKRSRTFMEKADMVYDPDAQNLTGSVFYDGYWQSEKYFSMIRDKLLEAFEFPTLDGRNKELIEKLGHRKCASIHVRRGDYLNNALFKGLTDKQYYVRAIDALLSQKDVDCFLIFSNDINWCRENLIDIIGEREIEFVDWNTGEDSYRDMQLMSLCHYNVIANSSFSWWGAWLNKHDDKLVFAPKKWMNVDKKLDIIPEDWIKI